MQRYHKPRYEVLLDPQLRYIESVIYVLGVQLEQDWRVDRHCERSRDDVVPGRGIMSRIQPEEVPTRLVDEVGMECAEFAIGSRIPEIVGELLGLHVDLERVGIGG